MVKKLNIFLTILFFIPILCFRGITQGKEPSAIFEEASPAVVVINVLKSSNTLSQGSGFVVTGEGAILTNFHLLSGGRIKDVQVKLKDGKVFPVKEIIAVNRNRDVCVIKIEANKLPVFSLGDSDSLVPGQKVLVIGSPEGYDYTISDGLFSQIRRMYDMNFLQFSAPVSGGSSGGPLLDMEGKVVGIVSGGDSDGQNINMAIPINEVKELIQTNFRVNNPEFDKLSSSYAAFLKAMRARQQGDLNAALKYYKEAVKADPDYAEAHAEIGFIYGSELGKVDDSITELKKAIALNPNISSAHANLGMAYSVKNMLDESIAEFRKAVDIDPGDSISSLNLAKSFYEQGKYDFALYYYDNAIKLGAIVRPEVQRAFEQYRKKDLGN